MNDGSGLAEIWRRLPQFPSPTPCGGQVEDVFQLAGQGMCRGSVQVVGDDDGFRASRRVTVQARLAGRPLGLESGGRLGRARVVVGLAVRPATRWRGSNAVAVSSGLAHDDLLTSFRARMGVPRVRAPLRLGLDAGALDEFGLGGEDLLPVSECLDTLRRR